MRKMPLFFNAPLKSTAEKRHRTSCGLIGMAFATLPAVLWTPFAIGIETPSGNTNTGGISWHL
jgi:hypothetical protein